MSDTDIVRKTMLVQLNSNFHIHELYCHTQVYYDLSNPANPPAQHTKGIP